MKSSTLFTRLLLAAGLFVSGAATADVTMATWGGAYGDAFKKHLAEPFEKETGIKVNLVYGNSLSNYQRLVAQKQKPQIDIVTLGSDVALQGYQDGLFEAVDPKAFPQVNVQKDKGLRFNDDKQLMFLPFFWLSYGIMYRTDLVPFEITSWNDLFDHRLRNKVGVSSARHAGAAFLLMMNKLAGGTEADVTPGINKVKSLDRNLLLIADGDAQQIQLISKGEVWAQTVVSGAVQSAIDRGLKARYVVPKEGAVGILDVFALVKNAPSSAEARRFLQFSLAPERLKAISDALNVIPTNPDVPVSQRVIDMVGGGSTESMERLVLFDERAQVQNRARWIEAWDKEIIPMTKR
jgi:putative spermidine/putrescine transport system substrate-binding protein